MKEEIDISRELFYLWAETFKQRFAMGPCAKVAADEADEALARAKKAFPPIVSGDAKK